MMSDEKKLKEEQLKYVTGGAGSDYDPTNSDYDPDEEWVVKGNIAPNNSVNALGYEKDTEWIFNNNK